MTEKNKVSLKCPICSFKTEISIGGISRAPKNYLLERQMQDELKKLKTLQTSDEFCNLCYDNIQVCVKATIHRYHIGKFSVQNKNIFIVGNWSLCKLSSKSLRSLS